MTERNDSQNGTIPSAEDIAREAYAIFEARGWQDGKDVEDWLEAERRLTAFLSSGTPIASDSAVRPAPKNGQPASRRRTAPPVPADEPKRAPSSARS